MADRDDRECLELARPGHEEEDDEEDEEGKRKEEEEWTGRERWRDEGEDAMTLLESYLRVNGRLLARAGRQEPARLGVKCACGRRKSVR